MFSNWGEAAIVPPRPAWYLVMPRILIHIGFEKTGTTSVQRFLSANHDRLLQQHGVLYPQSPALCRDDAHSTLTAGLLPAAACDFVSPEARPSITAVREALGEALELAPKLLVLSAEHLSSRLDDAAVGQLAQLIQPHPVEILVYARRQVEMGVSAFSTHLKCGRRDWFTPREISPKNPYYDFERMLAPWAHVFGRSAIQLRIFDPRHLHRENIIDDVLKVLDIDDTAGMARPQPLNPSLNLAEAALLHALNQCVPSWEEAAEHHRPEDYHQAHELRLKILEEAAEIPEIRDAPPLSSLLTSLDLLRVERRFRKTNARIARDYLGTDQLFAEPSEPGRRPERLFIRRKPTLDARQLAQILLRLTEPLHEGLEPRIRARLPRPAEQALRPQT